MSTRRDLLAWCYLVVPVFLAWLAIGYVIGTALAR